jgi:hypothetical protein
LKEYATNCNQPAIIIHSVLVKTASNTRNKRGSGSSKQQNPYSTA